MEDDQRLNISARKAEFSIQKVSFPVGMVPFKLQYFYYDSTSGLFILFESASLHPIPHSAKTAIMKERWVATCKLER
jgi:hypothetical protein